MSFRKKHASDKTGFANSGEAALVASRMAAARRLPLSPPPGELPFPVSSRPGFYHIVRMLVDPDTETQSSVLERMAESLVAQKLGGQTHLSRPGSLHAVIFSVKTERTQANETLPPQDIYNTIEVTVSQANFYKPELTTTITGGTIHPKNADGNRYLGAPYARSDLIKDRNRVSRVMAGVVGRSVSIGNDPKPMIVFGATETSLTRGATGLLYATSKPHFAKDAQIVLGPLQIVTTMPELGNHSV